MPFVQLETYVREDCHSITLELFSFGDSGTNRNEIANIRAAKNLGNTLWYFLAPALQVLFNYSS